MIIVNCEQNSEQWFKEKLGKPSASNASRIITNEGEPSKQRTSYLYTLCGEILTGKQEESYQNGNMLTGQEREDESRKFYEFSQKVKVKQVGVIYQNNQKKFLCSPDGIIQNKYGLELKNVLPKTQVKYLLDNKLPSEYFSQIQFSLCVTGFKYWVFCSYVPSMKPLIIRVKPDKEFQYKLKKELTKFCQDLEAVIRKVK